MGTPLQGHSTSDTLLRRLPLLSTPKLRSGEAYTRHSISKIDSHGIPVASQKTEGPTTTLTFLGILINTHTFELQLPRDKLHRTQQLLREWSHKPSCTRHQLDSLLGICLMRLLLYLRAERSFAAYSPFFHAHCSHTTICASMCKSRFSMVENISPGMERQVVFSRSQNYSGSHVGCIRF